MIKECNNCHWTPTRNPEVCYGKDCYTDHNHPAWKAHTNADKVRNMTDAQLAQVFSQVSGDVGQWLRWLQETTDD